MSAASAEDRAAFDEAALLEEARSKTSLSDFGDARFREPLSVLLHSLREEAQLNAAGREMMRGRILESLVTRLQTEAWFSRHPEIADEQLGAPLVIVGLTRTGTTMLHRTLGSDPRLYAVLWWQARFPAPLPDTHWDQVDPRIAPAEAEVAAILAADPAQASIHPWDAQAPDEEIMLQEHSFLSHVPEVFCNLATYRTWLNTQDWTPSYQYLRRLLQFLQWQKRQRGEARERWVLKTPGHLGYIDTLFAVFPGARVIQTHRDPMETIPSAASMNHSHWKLSSDHVDPEVVAHQWMERMAWAMQRCIDARERYAADRFDLTPEAQAAMQGWLLENQRDKRPAHDYTLQEYGFTEAEIKAAFAGYRERFIEPRL